jgi:hypothetical protein
MIKLGRGRIIFSPGGGVATDGASIQAARAANFSVRDLRYFEKYIIDDIKERVAKGQMTVKDYVIDLHVTMDEISAVTDGQYKWILWKSH